MTPEDKHELLALQQKMGQELNHMSDAFIRYSLAYQDLKTLIGRLTTESESS